MVDLLAIIRLARSLLRPPRRWDFPRGGLIRALQSSKGALGDTRVLLMGLKSLKTPAQSWRLKCQPISKN